MKSKLLSRLCWPLKTTLTLLLLVLFTSSQAQIGTISTCMSDFENGTVSPWSAYTAINSGINNFVSNSVSFTSGVVSGRHTIVSPGSDPVVTSINRVHTSSYALRLGNSSVGAEAEKVSRQVTVTERCLSFWYALVFEDDNHPANEQPFFMFRVLDNSGNAIHTYIRPASNDPFFTPQWPGIIYRDWTQYTVDLNAYLNQTVTLEFINADCYRSSHFGYTYLDDICFLNCAPPCEDCDDLFHSISAMNNISIITRDGGTDSTCCFKFNFIFDADYFACDPYGVKVFKDGDPSEVYSSYSSNQGLVYENRLLDPSVLNFCLDKDNFTGPVTVRIAFYDKNGNLICDTLKRTLKPCCDDCEDVINLPDLYTTYPVVTYKGSTHSACCYRINLPFSTAEPFKCDVFEIRVYEQSTGGTLLSSLSSGTPLQGMGVNLTDLEFCLARVTFTAPKTIVVALYDSLGNLICDSIKRTIEPCYTQGDCKCDDLFANDEFAAIPVIKKDPNRGNETTCCFLFEPFRDSGVIKCPYYGYRIYKEDMADIPGYTFFSLYSNDPVGGPGANPSPTDSFRFCIGAHLLDSGMTVRIEYLDSTGKVICSKVQELYCEESCCDNVIINLYYDTAHSNTECCFYLWGYLVGCNKTAKVELWEETSSGWVMVSSVTPSMTLFNFGRICREKGDSSRFVLMFKDSLWRTICHKEISTYCDDCCDEIDLQLVYKGSSVGGMYYNCCWDIFAYLPQHSDCPFYFPVIYDENEEVLGHISVPSVPWPTYVGQECSETVLHPYVYTAPGSSTTITLHLKKVLAIYDSNGDLLCTREIEDSCTRTFTVPIVIGGGLEGLKVSPNPFDKSFTMDVTLPQAMAVNVKVVNGAGTLMFEQDFGTQPAGTFSQTIPVQSLPPGVYTLSVNNGAATTQIVKQ